MTRVAAIDCGTNSIRLLVADVAGRDDGSPRLVEVAREMEVVRLGQGVDRTGELAPEALARTLAATRRYAAICADAGVDRVRFVATSATRDARNRAEFVEGVRAAIGVEPEVVSGAEEAALSFAGAASALVPGEGPALVVDLGGGSTELVLGATSAGAPSSISLDVGSVRLTERHLVSDPPTQAEIDAAASDVRAALDDAAAVVPLGETGTLIGVAGSITTVAAHAMRLEAYDRTRIDGARIPVGIVLAACQDLLAMTREERAALPYMHPGRVDVIGAGALVWFEIVTRVHAAVAARGGQLRDVVTSEHDILDGIALSLA
ncbi:Ppx/GppA phosphatase [Beutenbergia cavernae DSM 12333]|uniref:Ppx/GppA phosphatase n=1 Tax=Beutenbergia cavernae (strain ATCC BAA-8 / DSM 12333 / CCUG 43141 / JCM 11478 / NBRC 16432 / NCIMB 13614 / HKI 0122) TaxID=471853 RepID=C5C097_BEUC1|nr:Ppx/GppA phosphatase family protein [Beutenbergia cavernae]ACQ79283.1 Ppx/GppA phosphatase [Beutenbergia cavernae DSM 12333]